MRSTFRLMLACVILSIAAQAQDDAEDAVRAVFQSFSSAFAEADTARLSPLLAHEYMHINGSSGSIIDRGTWLSWIASRRAELDRGVLTIRTYDVRDLIIRMHGETAILTGIVHSTGERMGEPFTTHVRFTNVWTRHDGQWQRSFFHDSHIPEPQHEEDL